MGKSYSTVLCVDIGSDTLKAAEFAYSHEGTMDLVNFDFVEFGYTDAAALESQETSVEMLIALKKLLAETKFTSKLVNVSLSAQSALIRFVKLPALTDDENKINQIIEFEAKQNSPFPMDKTVWDAQIVGVSEDSTEIDVMIIYVRSEEVESVVKLIRESGRKIGNIEVAPTAGYNACRANMVGENACEMILNIGGHCSTLSFVDNGKLFERTISIAGNSITQQISKEFGISFKEAEDLKRRHGFVALGGAYEDPDSEVAAIVSKIVRNQMTRLHGEISRSINLYRAHQKGNKPEKLYLAGGSSVMEYMPRFFEEKLKLPVEYLNPFQIVSVSEALQEPLAELAHLYSEVIGLGLRNVGVCPVEVSLVPDSLRRERIAKQKDPYFYASAFALLLCLGMTYWSFSKQYATVHQDEIRASGEVRKTELATKQVDSAYRKLNSAVGDFQQTLDMLKERDFWPDLFNKVQAAVPPEIWFSSIHPISSLTTTAQKSKVVEAPQDGGFGGFGGFGGGFGARREAAAQKAVEQEYKWIEFNGYIRTSSKDKDPARIYNDFKASLEKTGLFKHFSIADGDRMIQNFKLAPSGSNISSFRIEAELVTPIKR